MERRILEDDGVTCTLLVLCTIVSELIFWYRSFTFSSNKSLIWWNNFSVYYPDVCLQLNMFRALLCSWSGRPAGPTIYLNCTMMHGITNFKLALVCCTHFIAIWNLYLLPSYGKGARSIHSINFCHKVVRSKHQCRCSEFSLFVQNLVLPAEWYQTKYFTVIIIYRFFRSTTLKCYSKKGISFT